MQPLLIPTRAEINPFDCLDGQAAEKTFFGKDLEAAEKLFPQYEEDLLYMGPVAFRYYVQAAIRYFRRADADSSGIIGFCSTLELRLELEPEELIPIADQLANICGYIVQHHDRFKFPISEEDKPAFISLLREQFGKLEITLGGDSGYENPEDLLETRPRFAALQQAFQRLSQQA
jgi:hypothetical protein